MEAKEKAIELIDKYVGFKLNPYNDPEMSQTLYKAKKNALICVNQILFSLYDIEFYKQEHAIKIAKYWKEVKQEINKL
jgi:uncharacterized protein (UPF0212 family)